MQVSISECELYTGKDTFLSIGLLLHMLGIAHHNVIENFQATLVFPVIATDLFSGNLLCPMDDSCGVSLNLVCSSSFFGDEGFFFVRIFLTGGGDCCCVCGGVTSAPEYFVVRPA
jgi:hypothetical protein